MKKGKLNNRGFVLAETLVVSVFIAAIFAVLYNNFYPLIGEYEKREVFDDIDSKYATYWIKRIIQHEKTNLGSLCSLTRLSNADTPYCQFTCEMVGEDSMRAMCHELVKKAQIKNNPGANASSLSDDVPVIYITTYRLTNMKNYVDENGEVSGGMQRYLRHLPEYKWDSLNNAKYRVLVEFKRLKDDNDYTAYSTFEVVK